MAKYAQFRRNTYRPLLLNEMVSIDVQCFQLSLSKFKIANYRKNSQITFFWAINFLIWHYSNSPNYNILNSRNWQHWKCNAIAVVAVESVRTNRVFNEFPTDSILSLLLVRWHLLLLHYSNSQKIKFVVIRLHQLKFQIIPTVFQDYLCKFSSNCIPHSITKFQNQFSLDWGNRFQNSQRCLNPLCMGY